MSTCLTLISIIMPGRVRYSIIACYADKIMKMHNVNAKYLEAKMRCLMTFSSYLEIHNLVIEFFD